MILDTFVGADAHIGPRSAHRFYENLRRIRRFPTGRCGHRPLQGAVHEQDWPSIPEMRRNGIIAVCPRLRVVHLSEAKTIGMVAILRPKRAFRPRSGQKIARVSAQNDASPAPLFSPFFSGKTEKNGPAEQRLRCYRKRDSPVNTEKGPTESSAPAGCMDKTPAEQRLRRALEQSAFQGVDCVCERAAECMNVLLGIVRAQRDTDGAVNDGGAEVQSLEHMAAVAL